MKLKAFIFSAVFILPFSFSYAEGVLRNAGGMPLCAVVDPGKTFVSFEWTKDVYDKRIFGVLNHGDVKTDPMCSPSSDKTYTTQRTSDKTHVELASNSESIWGLPLSDDLKLAMNQLQLGGTVLRTGQDLTAAGYLQNHPISDFSVQINRGLVKKYGVGFTSDIYKTWLEQKPANKSFRDLVIKNINVEKTGNAPIPLATRLKDYTFAINYGFGYTMDNNIRFKPLKEDLEEFGLNVEILETDAFGDAAKNSASIRDQLIALMAKGRHVIVVSGSKGSIEAVGAVSDLASLKSTDSKTTNSGDVAAVINLAGIVKGSFVVDWVSSSLHWPFVKPKLFKQFNERGANLANSDSVNSIKSMSTKYVTDFYKQHPIGNNKNPVYLSFVGVTTGDGMAQDSALREMQDDVTRAEIGEGFGANDGYVEYPGTTIPDDLGLKNYALAFDSSHVILDGSFNGISMSQKVTRQLVLRGILQSLSDLMSPPTH